LTLGALLQAPRSSQKSLDRSVAARADPAIARIVEDECARRGVPYARYNTLPEIIARFTA
jgi:hypothetical protein